MLKTIIFFLIIISSIPGAMASAVAHEDKNWRHARADITGYAIKQCPYGVFLWKQADEKWLPVLFSHGILHIGRLQDDAKCPINDDKGQKNNETIRENQSR